MKLGFFTMPVHPPERTYWQTLKEDREAFILADRLGCTEGYCGEHLTDAVENIPNSMMFLATLLDATKRMKVGTAVANLPHSHPVIVASNAAMLDNLFQGRFILGIGAGILRSDAEALGLLDHDRQAMFVEAIDQILAIWAGEAPYDIKGKFWNISTTKTNWPEVGVGGIVKPYQKPHPPIVGTASDPESKGLIALQQPSQVHSFLPPMSIEALNLLYEISFKLLILRNSLNGITTSPGKQPASQAEYTSADCKTRA